MYWVSAEGKTEKDYFKMDVPYRPASGAPSVLCRVRKKHSWLALSNHSDAGPLGLGLGDGRLRLTSQGEGCAGPVRGGVPERRVLRFNWNGDVAQTLGAA